MTQNFVVLGRKYRPKDLGEVVAQNAICKVISNSIRDGHIPSSYLFTGIRGTGKTSLARIIAKTVNCTNLDKSGEYISPCNKCENCKAFNKQNHPDIIEIDAASHTGVDDIRVIIDNSQYRAMMGKYKVYIIDEVHMLSKSAFNALLKTLEEPPENLLFILATTEMTKVPSTIKSRCQKFLLKRFSNQDILELMKHILIKEKLEYEDKALELIASESEGSARDALSLLDQSISLSSGSIVTSSTILEMLGFEGYESIINLLRYIIDKDAKSAFLLLESSFNNGTNIVIFFEKMSDILCYLSKLSILKDYVNDEYSFYQKDLLEISNMTSLSYLTNLWNIINVGINNLKNCHNVKIAAEMILVKAIYSITIPSLHSVLKKSISEEKNKSESVNGGLKKKSEETINISLDNILRNLCKDQQLDLYYYLMNEVECDIIGDTLRIKHDKINKNRVIEIEKYIFKCFNKKVTVDFTQTSNFIPYKSKITEQFKQSSEYEMISKVTPINIKEILIS